MILILLPPLKFLVIVNHGFFSDTGERTRKTRATAEQVMDPRTRMILFKLLSKGVISEINGCISTGKEANVYHATAAESDDKAVKVRYIGA